MSSPEKNSMGGALPLLVGIGRGTALGSVDSRLRGDDGVLRVVASV